MGGGEQSKIGWILLWGRMRLVADEKKEKEDGDGKGKER